MDPHTGDKNDSSDDSRANTENKNNKAKDS